MHAPSNQSKCKKTRSSLQNARQRREFKHAIKILQMQNKWNSGLKDHNQNPLMSNQQKFTNVKRWGIISNGKSIENISNGEWETADKKKREEKRKWKKEKKRRAHGMRTEDMWPCTTAAPTWRRGLKKKARLVKRKRGRTAQNGLFDPKERKRRQRNERMEKKKRREERSKKPPQGRSLNDAY